MRGFIKGLLAGLAVAGLVATISYGDQNAETEAKRHVVSEFKVNPEATNCRVSVGYGRITYGDRCFSGDVVTGASDGYLRCSSIDVRCF